MYPALYPKQNGAPFHPYFIQQASNIAGVRPITYRLIAQTIDHRGQTYNQPSREVGIFTQAERAQFASPLDAARSIAAGDDLGALMVCIGRGETDTCDGEMYRFEMF